MKNKKMIYATILITLLLLWIVALNMTIKNKNAQITSIIDENTSLKEKVKGVITANDELVKVNDILSKATVTNDAKMLVLENELNIIKNDKIATDSCDYIENGPYLVEFKTLYEKPNWTQEDRSKLIDLFVLIMTDDKSRFAYYDYLYESPDMTIYNLIESGVEGSVTYSHLFRLVEISDGALADMTYGSIYNQFLEDAEGLFKANYYGQRKHGTLSRQLFPYDTDAYPVDYQNKILSIYEDILMDNELENAFKVYIQEEKKEAENAFGR